MEKIFRTENGAQIKRLSCLSHTLQLVMGSFDSFRNSRGQLPLFAKTIRKARGLVGKFHNSGIGTARLQELGGKKLIGDVVCL